MSKELREQFEDETKNWIVNPSHDSYQKRYIEWLESKHKEAEEKLKIVVKSYSIEKNKSNNSVLPKVDKNKIEKFNK